MYAILLFLHIASAVVWLGGMVFAHFALRPAAVELLQPPVRLALMANALGRFFRLVIGAVAVILLTGAFLLGRAGMSGAPVGWHAMAALGVIMACIFGFIYAAPYRRLVEAVSAQQWQDAAAALGRIRVLVAVNMGLGFGAVLAAAWART